MWIFIALGVGILALAHTAPAPFLFDAIAGRRALWHMPRTDPPTIYLSFDDGPNPTTTPDLLDVLAREGVHATFFLIDRHITDQTAPLVRRIFADGHAVALHSHTRAYMLMSPDTFAATLTRAADHIARGMAQRLDVRRTEAHRSSADRLGVDAVGLELVPEAHRRLSGDTPEGPPPRRRYRRDARRRRVGAVRRPAAHRRGHRATRSRASPARISVRDDL